MIIGDKLCYQDFFKDNHKTFLIIKDEHITYHDFWNRVEESKLENTKYQLIFGEGLEFLIKYFATISRGMTAICLSKETPQSYTESLCQSIFDYSDQKIVSPISEIPIKTPSSIVFTSGSTGRPKPICLTHENFIYSALGTNEFYELDQTCNWASSLPFNHVGGLLIIYRMILCQGSSTILKPGNIAEELKSAKEITHLSAVSTQLSRLLEDKELLKSRRLSQLQGIILGGAKCPTKLLKAAIDRGIKLSNSFGQTETCAQVLATPLCLDLKVLKSVGKPLNYTSVSIAKDSCLSISGQVICLTNEHKPRDYIQTTDLAYVDEVGNFHITGRADEVFISGGENISGQEIDDILLSSFEDLKSAKTFPIPNEIYNQVGLTLLEQDRELSYQDFKQTLKQSLPSYKIPKSIALTKDTSCFKGDFKISKEKINHFFGPLSFLNDKGLHTKFSGNFSKPLIIIFHGFMGQGEDFSFLVEHFEEHYCFALVDLPGHGQSKNHFKSWSEFDEHLSKGLNSLTYSYSLYGYSMGGRLALNLAPKLNNYTRIILESAGPGLTREQEKLKRASFDESLLTGISTQEQLDEFNSKWYDLSLFKDIKKSQYYKDMISRRLIDHVPGWRESLKTYSLSKQEDLRQKVATMRDTYYIYGELDKKYEQFAKELSTNFKVYPIMNASHNPHVSNRIEYLKAVKSILLK